MSHHYNPALVVLSIILSFLSSYTGLRIGARTHGVAVNSTLWSITSSAIALGGGAIWAMHFIAMLAFHAGGMAVRYDLALTILSLALAIGFTGLGMAMVSRYGSKPLQLVAAGTAMGLGVASMHYTGMSAMRMDARISYEPLLVAASVAIAVVASTVALWLVLNVRTGLTRVLASAVMAVAVAGMHYTGMAATRFTASASDSHAFADGLSPSIMAAGVVAATVAVLLTAFTAHTLEARFTEQHAWVSQLEDARVRAEAASQAKGDFLATMSHEIRTPLNSIIGFTDLLLEDQDLNERQRRQVDLIHNSGRALLTVVNDILDFSKIEAGKIELEKEPMAIQSLISHAVAIVRSEAETKGLELSVVIDPGLRGFYSGDEARLRQVLLNLLNNAVKFTPTGSVALTAARKGGSAGHERLRFEVSDTGHGIDKTKQDRLFEDFSQADGSVTRQFGGTGLGLAISKRLIELMGGEIGFVSEEGKGSIFWIELLMPRTARPVIPTGAVEGVRGQSALRILLAEDVPVNQELVCAILAREGHQIVTVDDGAAAVAAVRRQLYDLVLMDIQMPKMDGVSATRIIRSIEGAAGQIPILALTANVLPEQIREFLAVGMNGHVAKPIKQADLHAAISRVGTLGLNRNVAEDPAEPVPIFDHEAFGKLGELLPPDRLKTHLLTLDAQLQTAFDALSTGELKQTAHKLVSQAGMFGFMQLSDCCRQVEEASPDRGLMNLRLAGTKSAAATARKKIGELVASH